MYIMEENFYFLPLKNTPIPCPCKHLSTLKNVFLSFKKYALTLFIHMLLY